MSHFAQPSFPTQSHAEPLVFFFLAVRNTQWPFHATAFFAHLPASPTCEAPHHGSAFYSQIGKTGLPGECQNQAGDSAPLAISERGAVRRNGEMLFWEGETESKASTRVPRAQHGKRGWCEQLTLKGQGERLASEGIGHPGRRRALQKS